MWVQCCSDGFSPLVEENNCDVGVVESSLHGVRQNPLYSDIRLQANQIGCLLACQNQELNPQFWEAGGW